MAKVKKTSVGPYEKGDKVITIKQINGKFEGQLGVVEACDDKAAAVSFDTGMFAGKVIRCPLHAIKKR